MLSLGKLGSFRARASSHNLDGGMASLVRGDVVLTRTGQAGIVWRADSTQVWYVPVVRGYGHRHRAEVALDGAWASLGVAVTDPVAECHKIHVKRLAVAKLIGRMPEAVLATVIAAVMHEFRVRQTEDRLHFSPRLALSPVLS